MKRTAKQEKTPEWVTLRINHHRLDVLRVWRIGAPKHQWPEIAILRPSSEAVDRLVEDANKFRNFLNKYKIFSKNVRALGPCISLPANKKALRPPCYVFMVIHDRSSSAAWIRVPCLWAW